MIAISVRRNNRQCGGISNTSVDALWWGHEISANLIGLQLASDSRRTLLRSSFKRAETSTNTMPMPLSPACRTRRPLNGSNGHPENHMNRSRSYNGHTLNNLSKDNGSPVDGPLNHDERPLNPSASQNGSPTNESSNENRDTVNSFPEHYESRFRPKTPIAAVFAEHMSLRRTRSLNAPSPIQQFGPCGRIMKNSAMVMTIQDPASQRLTWYKAPMAVLVIKKVHDHTVLPPFMQLVNWLADEKKMIVFVENSTVDDPLLKNNPQWAATSHHKVQTFRDGQDDLTDKIDFIICLGGDGTLLYASSLFQQSVPPVMAFHLGSLGFLTPFKFDNFQGQVESVLEGHAALTLRSRLRCIILRKDSDTRTEPPINLLVLNEVVVDRGPSPYLSNIDLYLDGKKITSVQGDGLIVSTPTGSTAYAVAAGASMMHPSVPAIMVTPICPHSLSFRPIVVPAGVELKICLNPDARNTAWASFDGMHHQELRKGDSLRVTTSVFPVPSICAGDQITDWFDSLDECLRWNDRKKQRQLDTTTDYPPPGPEYKQSQS